MVFPSRVFNLLLEKAKLEIGRNLLLLVDLLNGRRLMEEPLLQEDCEEPNLESHQMVDDLFEKVYFKIKSGLEDLIHQKRDDINPSHCPFERYV